MKKFLALMCAFAMFPSVSFAEEEIKVFVNGSAVEFDQPPIIYNDRTLVPMRAIFEELRLTVQWFEEEQRVTAFDGEVNITMLIGKPYIYLDDEEFEIDTAPMIVNDRTLVPLRAIGESLNGDVEWDGELRTVTITIPERETYNADEELEHKILELTNAEREKYGLEPLVWNEELAALSRAHSADMAERGFFNHNNPDGKSPFDRMKDAGISYFAAAENIAAGQATPEKAMEAWMNSDGHRANILNPKLKELGVGVAHGGKYGIYWTQNFAALK